jgi:catalase
MFGEHTFSLISKEGKRVWVKFHFKTEQGIKCLSDEEAEKIAGMDRDYHGRDLENAIKRGDFPKWKLFIQVMTEEQARKMPYNPFDITKVWYHKDFPLIEVGELVLNRNPENYFAEVEQAAFTPAHVVPGIGFSPDRFLQGRLFAYGDAQRYRLGVNYNLLPVNRPHCLVNDNSRDGYMRFDGNYGGAVGYMPNGQGEWYSSPEVAEPPLPLEGAVWHYDPKDDPTDNCFEQPGKLYRLMSEEKKALLIGNTARAMTGVRENIRYRHAAHCYLADQDYGKRIAEALKLDLKKVQQLAKLSNAELNKVTADR